MSTQALILGLAIVVGVLLLTWRAVETRRGARAKISLSKILEVELEIDAPSARDAREAAERAAEGRGIAGAGTVQIDTARSAHLARVLWVDDRPDNNVFEVISAERLGLLVTAATSTEAASAYASRLDYSIVVTDVVRQGDSEAGRDTIEWAASAMPGVPVIVYTGSRVEHEGLRAVGAADVVDSPSALLVALQRHRPR